MPISPELQKIIACPKCKGTVNEEPGRLVCGACRLSYPVREGIPVMLLAEATPLTD